jgi:AraC-like DNA-binding protein
MLSTDQQLSEIAAGCGFADQPHLCRVFRDRLGQSPAVWRRERRDTSFRRPSNIGTSEIKRLQRDQLRSPCPW